MEGKLSSSTTSTRNIKKKTNKQKSKPQLRIKSVIHQWWIIDNITNGHHQFHRFRFSFFKTFLLFVFSLNFLLRQVYKYLKNTHQILNSLWRNLCVGQTRWICSLKVQLRVQVAFLLGIKILLGLEGIREKNKTKIKISTITSNVTDLKPPSICNCIWKWTGRQIVGD